MRPRRNWQAASALTGFGQAMRASTAAGVRNQSPSSCAGTAPPGGGERTGAALATAPGPGAAAEVVAWPQADASRPNAHIAARTTVGIAFEIPGPPKAAVAIVIHLRCFYVSQLTLRRDPRWAPPPSAVTRSHHAQR